MLAVTHTALSLSLPPVRVSFTQSRACEDNIRDDQQGLCLSVCPAAAGINDTLTPIPTQSLDEDDDDNDDDKMMTIKRTDRPTDRID